MMNMTSRIVKRKIPAVIFGLILFLLGTANISFAKFILLSWDANQETGVAGHKVYYGTNSGTYAGAEALEGSSPIDFGNSASATFVNLDDTK